MPLRNASLEIIQQVLSIISVVGDKYSTPYHSELEPVGTHIRHIIDHYWAFQRGIKSGNIDYNQRNRKAALERDPVQAVIELEAIYNWFVSEPLDNSDLLVTSEFSVSCNQSMQIHSCIERELVYLINHTLHHVAYANLLSTFLGVKTHYDLGVAPATASYYREQEGARCAQ